VSILATIKFYTVSHFGVCLSVLCYGKCSVMACLLLWNLSEWYIPIDPAIYAPQT